MANILYEFYSQIDEEQAAEAHIFLEFHKYH